LPTALLDSVEVWKALLTSGHGMPMEAMVRNLSKMTAIGLLGERECADWVVGRLTNADAIRASRIHPMKLLMASRQYQRGHGDKGKLSWSPERRVVDALDEAFKLAFGNVEPTGKRMMLALDVSGSMSSPVPGTTISCREASAAMALITCATEAACSVVAFGGQLTPVAMKGSMTVTQAVRVSDMNFGATDCALPMLHALKNGIAVDCFVVYTDSETWFGSVHPQVALQQYRAATGIQAKLVVVGMVSNRLTIADPSDPHTLNLAGFDTSTPEVLSMFARGEL
jgi:60 kDa SS-A/Ro ribonucleoprotein